MSTTKVRRNVLEPRCVGPENNCRDYNIVPREIYVPEEKPSLLLVSANNSRGDEGSLDAVDIDKTKEPVVGGIWASGMVWLGPALRRVKVLPGLMFQNGVPPLGGDNTTTGTATTAASTTSECPPEPLEAPPIPQEIVRLLVLGDARSGKTSLINAFVYHHSANTDGEQEKEESESHEELDEPESDWSFEYFKKDLAFCAPDEKTLRSVRAQLFDTTGSLGPGALGSKLLGWLSANETSNRFKELWGNADRILLVLSLDTPPDELLNKIQSWKKWVDHQEKQELSLAKKPVILMLNKSDLLPKDVHPTFWISFARNMSKLCEKLEIESWHVTSSNLEDDATVGSIDLAFRSILAAMSGQEISVVEEDDENNEYIVPTKRTKNVDESDKAGEQSIPSPIAATQEKKFENSGGPLRVAIESKNVNESDQTGEQSLPSPIAATQQKKFENSASPLRDATEPNAAIVVTP